MNKDISYIVNKQYNKIRLLDEFNGATSQTHHKRTTLDQHILDVIVESLRICKLFKIKDEQTISNILEASLYHDVGIIGRYEKFSNNLECNNKHPLNSVKIYTKIYGNNNKRVINAIKSHMFPMSKSLPRYKESWVVILADKVSAIKEYTGHNSLGKYAV